MIIRGLGNTTVALSGTVSNTTQFAPTLQLLPITALCNMVALEPIKQLSTIPHCHLLIYGTTTSNHRIAGHDNAVWSMRQSGWFCYILTYIDIRSKRTVMIGIHSLYPEEVVQF